MSHDDERREFFRIHDRIPLELRRITGEEFLELQDMIRYNSTQVLDRLHELYFLEPHGEPKDEDDQVQTCMQVINRKLDMIIEILGKSPAGKSYSTVHTVVNISGAGIQFVCDVPLSEGDFVELKVIVPVFPYPKITCLCQVVRSETRSEETVAGKANLDGAAPDANFRGDGFTGTQSSQDSSRESRTTNYEINKEEQQIVSPVGELKRLGVAVIVDGTYTKDEKTGEFTYVPRTAEEIARIKSLVSSAVGFDSARGDSIEVSSIAFGALDMSEGPSLVRNFIEMGQRLGKPLLTGLLIFLFLILVVRPVVMALIRPKVAEQEVEEVSSLPSTDERLAIEEALEVPEEALDTSRRLENAKNLAMQLTDQNMDQAIRLLKSWARQEA